MAASKYAIDYRSDLTTSGDQALMWEPGCPIQIVAVQIARRMGTSKCYLQIKVRNISNACISSLSLFALVKSKEGGVAEQPVDARDIDVRSGELAVIEAIELQPPNVVEATVYVRNVQMGSAKWESKGDPIVVSRPAALDALDSIIEYRRSLLMEKPVDNMLCDVASHIPYEKGDWWVCGCGQVNERRDRCCCCHVSLEIQQSLLDISELEEGAVLAAKREKNRTRVGIAAAVAALSITLISILLFLVIPSLPSGQDSNDGQVESTEKENASSSTAKKESAPSSTVKYDLPDYKDGLAFDRFCKYASKESSFKVFDGDRGKDYHVTCSISVSDGGAKYDVLCKSAYSSSSITMKSSSETSDISYSVRLEDDSDESCTLILTPREWNEGVNHTGIGNNKLVVKMSGESIKSIEGQLPSSGLADFSYIAQ